MSENPYESPRVVESPSPQGKPALLTCAHCGGGHSETGTDGPSSKDLFGFQEFDCRTCHNITTTPLSEVYRACYWAFAAGCACLTVFTIARGAVPVLALIAAIVPAHALTKDRKI